MPVRLGIIGAGPESRVFVEVLRSLDEARIIACCDRDFSQAEALARRLKAKPFRDTRALFKKPASKDAPAPGKPALRTRKPQQPASSEELAKADTLDAICVLATDRARAEAVVAALSNSCDVYLPAPFAATLASAQTLNRVATEHRVRLWTTHVARFTPSLEQVRKLLNARGAQVVACNGSWRIDEPDDVAPRTAKAAFDMVWLSAATRLVDTLRFVLGDVKAVNAHRSGETTTLHVEWKSGVLGAFVLHPACENALDFALRDSRLAWRETGVTQQQGDDTQHTAYAPDAARQALRQELRAWLQSVESGRRTAARSSPTDALQTLRVVLAIQQSARTHRPVRLSDAS